ncbi:MAG: FGGY-family carbohydrate kinase [Bacteroidota bacterium]
MDKEVVLIFDIGKTNKKVLLFDREPDILEEEETVFEETVDDDGFACDDIEKLEQWILEKCDRFMKDPRYSVRGINFTTYGATLAYLDGEGERLTPIYNYLKPMPEGVVEPVYEQYGGEEEFCRRTASPALGMLNSGFQALWLQQTKPGIFEKVRTILHFPQYLSHFLTRQIASEHTSIGCHTAFWDFDHMSYHPWTGRLGNTLPAPEPVTTVHPSVRLQENVPVGIGIHDSSSSLVPYFMKSDEEFVLISTGTWCISMNPFNHSPLTADQLKQDCLAYMSIQQNPVKSSRFFLGHIHDENVKYIAEAFRVPSDAYKNVTPDDELIRKVRQRTEKKRVFFGEGIPPGYIDRSVDLSCFAHFEEAYHQFMADLADLTARSIRLILEGSDKTRNLYITGGFSKNPIFVRLMAGHFPDKKVLTSEIANATSLGAALVIWDAIEPGFKPAIDLGLIQWEP